MMKVKGIVILSSTLKLLRHFQGVISPNQYRQGHLEAAATLQMPLPVFLKGLQVSSTTTLCVTS
jgi:hypothetical protein